MLYNRVTALIIFMTITSFSPTLWASSPDSTSASAEDWISGRVLIGLSSLNYNIGFGFEYRHAQALYTIRYIKGVESDLHTARLGHSPVSESRPLEVTQEYSVLYGKLFQAPYGQLSASLGMGLMHFALRGAHVRWNNITDSNENSTQIDEREAVDYGVINVPFEIQYTIMPKPFGVAISIFGNVNSRVFMIGFSVSTVFGTSINLE
jgi:hypothetical protein